MRELLKDLNYGSKVIKKTLAWVIWYWFKYVLAIGICGLVIGISVLFYYTPQFPKFLQEKFPLLPYTWDDGKVSVYVDENKLILNDRKGQSNEIKFSDIKNDFKLDKNTIVKWTEANKPWLLGVGLAILVSLILILGIFYLIWQTIMFLIWSAGFWIYSRMLKKNLQYLDIVKLVITASVISLFISALNIVFQDSLLGIIGVGTMVFYTGTWIYHLQVPQKSSKL